jgi:hypothetical protein
MPLAIGVSYHDFGRVGKSDAAVVTAILLNADGQQASVVISLPLFHAVIQSAHGRILEVNEVVLVQV